MTTIFLIKVEHLGELNLCLMLFWIELVHKLTSWLLTEIDQWLAIL